MKITKKQLKQIIQEEYINYLHEGRQSHLPPMKSPPRYWKGYTPNYDGVWEEIRGYSPMNWVLAPKSGWLKRAWTSGGDTEDREANKIIELAEKEVARGKKYLNAYEKVPSPTNPVYKGKKLSLDLGSWQRDMGRLTLTGLVTRWANISDIVYQGGYDKRMKRVRDDAASLLEPFFKAANEIIAIHKKISNKRADDAMIGVRGMGSSRASGPTWGVGLED